MAARRGGEVVSQLPVDQPRQLFGGLRRMAAGFAGVGQVEGGRCAGLAPAAPGAAPGGWRLAASPGPGWTDPLTPSATRLLPAKNRLVEVLPASLAKTAVVELGRPPSAGGAALWRSTGASGRPGRRRTVGGTRGYPRNAPSGDPLTVGPMKQIDFDRSMTFCEVAFCVSSHTEDAKGPELPPNSCRGSSTRSWDTSAPPTGAARPGPSPRPQGDRVLPLSDYTTSAFG